MLTDLTGMAMTWLCVFQIPLKQIRRKVKTVILSVTPEAAGAEYSNSLYVRNPCAGGGNIILKSTKDSCSSSSVNTRVSAQGGVVLFIENFTQNAFSDECAKTRLINVSDDSYACSPNKTFVKIYCDSDSTFTMNSDGSFPYAQLFYLDVRNNGTTGDNSTDDVHVDSLYNGLSLINVGACADPIPEERTNFIDALDIRSTIDSSKCSSNASLCRQEIKSAMITKRSTWGSNPNIKEKNSRGNFE